MSFGYDPEAVYQEADIEMAEFEVQAAEARALRKRGVCTHSSQLGGGVDFYGGEDIAAMRVKGHFPDRPTDSSITTQMDISEGKSLCLDCGELIDDPLARR